MHRFLPYLVCLLLAAASFTYARHHYLEKNSVTLANPFNPKASTQVTSPLADRQLFGSWVKDEWLFALVVPAALLGAGIVISFKK